jgi:hypothetical protein
MKKHPSSDSSDFADEACRDLALKWFIIKRDGAHGGVAELTTPRESGEIAVEVGRYSATSMDAQ